MPQRKFIYIVYRVSLGFGFDVRFLQAFSSEDLAKKFVKILTYESAKSSLSVKSSSYFVEKTSLIDNLSSLGLMFIDDIV